jgi:hypothetical protein
LKFGGKVSEKKAKNTLDTEDWVNGLITTITFDERVLLYRTSNADDFPVVEAITLVKNLVKIKEPKRLALASIVNAIFTQQTSAFMITKRDLDKLLKTDKNHNLNYLQPYLYTSLQKDLRDKFWEVREEPAGMRGGLYILKDEPAVSILKSIMIDQSYDEIQTKRIKKYYEMQEKGLEKKDPHAWVKERYGLNKGDKNE